MIITRSKRDPWVIFDLNSRSLQNCEEENTIWKIYQKFMVSEKNSFLKSRKSTWISPIIAGRGHSCRKFYSFFKVNCFSSEEIIFQFSKQRPFLEPIFLVKVLLELADKINSIQKKWKNQREKDHVCCVTGCMKMVLKFY